MLSTQTTLRKRSTVPSLEHAFTRTDLLITLGVLALLALVILPALANQRPRSARVSCANNLRQIGVGFQLWGNDHADQLPYETAVSDGGTQLHALAANVWLHLSWISNGVTTPKVFLCPSDSGQPARDFSVSSTSGYIHANFRDFATSYFLGYTGISTLNTPNAAIAGDRNVSTEAAEGCVRFGTAARVWSSRFPPYTGWKVGLHGVVGNVLSFDGRVQEVDTPGFRRIIAVPIDDIGNKHIIIPR